jgi:hypothetical protein
MATEIITLRIDPEAARVFKSAPAEEREKLGVLLGIWLKELGKDSSGSLKETMDQIGDKARARGLTGEVLDAILEED